MYALGGFKADSIQETHPWHPHRIDRELLDLSITAEAPIDEEAINRLGFLFHVPGIPGLGWRDYSVLQPADQPFYIGWSSIDAQDGHHVDTAVHRLRVDSDRIRMLNGPSSERTNFFAVNLDGDQVNLDIVDSGRLGSNMHTDIRLF